MVNSGSFESEGNDDRNAKAGFTQESSSADDQPAQSPVNDGAVRPCKTGLTETADSDLPSAARAIEPTPTKTELNNSKPAENCTHLSVGGPSERDPGLMEVKAEDGDVTATSDVQEKTSLCCSLPLDVVQGVIAAPSPTIEGGDEDSEIKVKQLPSRKLLCLYCERTFVSVNLRQKHVERSHSVKQNRRVSSRRQSPLAATPCVYCDKFNSNSSRTLKELFQHLVSEHSNKYYGCLPCEDRFLKSSLLADHNASSHPTTPSTDPVQQEDTIFKSEMLPPKEEIQTNDSLEQEEIPVKITRSKMKPSSSLSNPYTNKTRQKPNRSASINRTRQSVQLRNMRNKKFALKSSRIALKRSKRLQAKMAESQKKKRSRNHDKKTQKADQTVSTKTTDKSKSVTGCINPYPEFDSYFRVKKITDHSIDNLKISSLTFDDVFDKAFFNRIKCNIQENLLHHIDGKLFKNEESESRISNFEKHSNVPQEVQNSNSENYGCEISLNAVTPVASLSLSSQFGEDFESQIEYGSKPSKKKTQTRQDEVHYKYFTRRKYQASILQHKENRDLSKLDMWTQLVIKKRQQKMADDKKSAKEMLEYTTCEEYKNKVRKEELNRILDRRGPFEDLKEEATKKAALDKLNSASEDNISQESFLEVREVLNDILNRVFSTTEELTNEEGTRDTEEETKPQRPLDVQEIPGYLLLRRTSSLPSEGEIDRSDRIALICSSQETENFELPTNTVRGKDEMVELTGEWARCRMFVCAACGVKIPNIKLLWEHKSVYHQNVWAQHYEFVGNQSELYRHLSIPGLGKVGVVEDSVPCKLWRRSDARVCMKCGKVCNALGELHRHILECGGDWTWMLARKKCKYRPFGAKSRRKRRGLVKRIIRKTEPSEKKAYKKTFDGPRQRPSDADTIQRMLANLPAKRATRKIISLRDGIYKARKNQQITSNKKQNKIKCGKLMYRKTKLSSEKIINNDAQRSKNKNNMANRKSLRNFNKVLACRILDTNASLLVKRKLKTLANRRITRQTRIEVQDDIVADEAPEPLEKAVATSPPKRRTPVKIEKPKDDPITNEVQPKEEENNTISNDKIETENKKKLSVKKLLRGKINIKSFFPVKKKKSSQTATDNKNASQESDTVEEDESKVRIKRRSKESATEKPTLESIDNKTKPKRTGTFNNIVRTLSMRKRKADKKIVEPAKDNEETGSSEQITEKTEGDSISEDTGTTETVSKKRRLTRTFKSVIKRKKRLKAIENTSDIVQTDGSPHESHKAVTIPDPFLDQAPQENEESSSKVDKIIVPSTLEKNENIVDIASPVHTATNFDENNENPQIPENIFNLESNNEKSLQAKGNPNFDVTKTTQEEITDNNSSTTFVTVEKICPINIDTSVKSLNVPLLSPKQKARLRKPARGLNDCIAMLTSKLQQKTKEETSKVDNIFSLIPSKVPTIFGNRTNHRFGEKPDFILRIPTFKHTKTLAEDIEECALDLSQKSKSFETLEKLNNLSKTVESTPREKLNNFGNYLWTSVDQIIEDVIGNKCPVYNGKLLKTAVSDRMKQWNSVDDIIQRVVDNSCENILSEIAKTIPSHKQAKNKMNENTYIRNSIDDIIDYVAKGDYMFDINLGTENADVKKTKEIRKIGSVRRRKRKEIQEEKVQNISSDCKDTSLNSDTDKIPEVRTPIENVSTITVENDKATVDEPSVLNTAFIESSERKSGSFRTKSARKIGQRWRRSSTRTKITKDDSKFKAGNLLTSEDKKLYLETNVDNLLNAQEICAKNEESVGTKVVTNKINPLVTEDEPHLLENKAFASGNPKPWPSDSEDEVPLAILAKSDKNQSKAEQVTAKETLFVSSARKENKEDDNTLVIEGIIETEVSTDKFEGLETKIRRRTSTSSLDSIIEEVIKSARDYFDEIEQPKNGERFVTDLIATGKIKSTEYTSDGNVTETNSDISESDSSISDSRLYTAQPRKRRGRKSKSLLNNVQKTVFANKDEAEAKILMPAPKKRPGRKPKNKSTAGVDNSKQSDFDVPSNRGNDCMNISLNIDFSGEESLNDSKDDHSDSSLVASNDQFLNVTPTEQNSHKNSKDNQPLNIDTSTDESEDKLEGDTITQNNCLGEEKILSDKLLDDIKNTQESLEEVEPKESIETEDLSLKIRRAIVSSNKSLGILCNKTELNILESNIDNFDADKSGDTINMDSSNVDTNLNIDLLNAELPNIMDCSNVKSNNDIDILDIESNTILDSSKVESNQISNVESRTNMVLSNVESSTDDASPSKKRGRSVRSKPRRKRTLFTVRKYARNKRLPLYDLDLANSSDEILRLKDFSEIKAGEIPHEHAADTNTTENDFVNEESSLPEILTQSSVVEETSIKKLDNLDISEDKNNLADPNLNVSQNTSSDISSSIVESSFESKDIPEDTLEINKTDVVDGIIEEKKGKLSPNLEDTLQPEFDFKILPEITKRPTRRCRTSSTVTSSNNEETNDSSSGIVSSFDESEASDFELRLKSKVKVVRKKLFRRPRRKQNGDNSKVTFPNKDTTASEACDVLCIDKTVEEREILPNPNKSDGNNKIELSESLAKCENDACIDPENTLPDIIVPPIKQIPKRKVYRRIKNIIRNDESSNTESCTDNEVTNKVETKRKLTRKSKAKENSECVANVGTNITDEIENPSEKDIQEPKNLRLGDFSTNVIMNNIDDENTENKISENASIIEDDKNKFSVPAYPIKPRNEVKEQLKLNIKRTGRRWSSCTTEVRHDVTPVNQNVPVIENSPKTDEYPSVKQNEETSQENHESNEEKESQENVQELPADVTVNAETDIVAKTDKIIKRIESIEAPVKKARRKSKSSKKIENKLLNSDLFEDFSLVMKKKSRRNSAPVIPRSPGVYDGTIYTRNEFGPNLNKPITPILNDVVLDQKDRSTTEVSSIIENDTNCDTVEPMDMELDDIEIDAQIIERSITDFNTPLITPFKSNIEETVIQLKEIAEATPVVKPSKKKKSKSRKNRKPKNHIVLFGSENILDRSDSDKSLDVYNSPQFSIIEEASRRRSERTKQSTDVTNLVPENEPSPPMYISKIKINLHAAECHIQSDEKPLAVFDFVPENELIVEENLIIPNKILPEEASALNMKSPSDRHKRVKSKTRKSTLTDSTSPVNELLEFPIDQEGEDCPLALVETLTSENIGESNLDTTQPKNKPNRISRRPVLVEQSDTAIENQNINSLELGNENNKHISKSDDILEPAIGNIEATQKSHQQNTVTESVLEIAENKEENLEQTPNGKYGTVSSINSTEKNVDSSLIHPNKTPQSKKKNRKTSRKALLSETASFVSPVDVKEDLHSIEQFQNIDMVLPISDKLTEFITVSAQITEPNQENVMNDSEKIGIDLKTMEISQPLQHVAGIDSRLNDPAADILDTSKKNSRTRKNLKDSLKELEPSEFNPIVLDDQNNSSLNLLGQHEVSLPLENSQLNAVVSSIATDLIDCAEKEIIPEENNITPSTFDLDTEENLETIAKVVTVTPQLKRKNKRASRKGKRSSPKKSTLISDSKPDSIEQLSNPHAIEQSKDLNDELNSSQVQCNSMTIGQENKDDVQLNEKVNESTVEILSAEANSVDLNEIANDLPGEILSMEQKPKRKCRGKEEIIQPTQDVATITEIKENNVDVLSSPTNRRKPSRSAKTKALENLLDEALTELTESDRNREETLPNEIEKIDPLIETSVDQHAQIAQENNETLNCDSKSGRKRESKSSKTQTLDNQQNKSFRNIEIDKTSIAVGNDEEINENIVEPTQVELKTNDAIVPKRQRNSKQKSKRNGKPKKFNKPENLTEFPNSSSEIENIAPLVEENDDPVKENALGNVGQANNSKISNNNEKEDIPDCNGQAEDMALLSESDFQELRRSRRSSRKIASYNENELADPLLEDVESSRRKRRKDKSSEKNLETRSLDNCHNKGKLRTGAAKNERKLNSDELFDLLKASDDMSKTSTTQNPTMDGLNEKDNLTESKFENCLDKPTDSVKEIVDQSTHQKDADKLYEFNENSEGNDIIETNLKQLRGRRKQNSISLQEEKTKNSNDSFNNEVSKITSSFNTPTTLSNNEIDYTSSNLTKFDILDSFIDERLGNNPASNKASTKSDKVEKVSEPEEKPNCEICNKSFTRIENLIKHKRTLTHISKLSELEAREAQEKSRQEQKDDDSSKLSDVFDSILDSSKHYLSNGMDKPREESATLPSVPFNVNANNHTLKLADIISDVLNKPVLDVNPESHNNFSDVLLQNATDVQPEFRRYKSLGERKSFDLEAHTNTNENLVIKSTPEVNYYEPSLSKTTIVEKQISLLQNIIENQTGINYIDDISVSSNNSTLENNESPSELSLHLKEDSTYSNTTNAANSLLKPTANDDSFLKPTQYEEISEDSTNLRSYDDQKLRKTLNRDEELFLECCSLLKSGSEVSSYSKKSNKVSMNVLNKMDLKMSEEPEWLEHKNLAEKQPYTLVSDYSDNSRIPTPLGDSYADDASNSNTISSNWEMARKGPVYENVSPESHKSITFEEVLHPERDSHAEDTKEKAVANFGIISKTIDSVARKTTSETSNSFADLILENKNTEELSDGSTSDSKKMLTKGAMKIFEGLKVSIPTDDLNIEEVLNCSPQSKKIINEATEEEKDDPDKEDSMSPSKPSRTSRKSKPIKNKSQLGSKLLFKKNKKKASPKPENVSEKPETNQKDVYDFEETQDNSDIFPKPDFRTFRCKKLESEALNKKTEIEDTDNESRDYSDSFGVETQSLSSVSSVSNTSSRKPKADQNITKKKCMIMGRIFKNAVKSKVEEEIKNLPVIDNNELVENYVLNCTNPTVKRTKMSDKEMNLLFDKLLDGEEVKSKQTEEPPKLANAKSKVEPKGTEVKKKAKVKNKKRARGNSESTDDEFSINKTKKRNRKNGKEEDNCINLEQELKECIGVASRKSQRKCTSGKQNVLVEYWSSDDSAFEAMLESQIIEPKPNQDKAQLEREIVEVPEKSSPLLELRQEVLEAVKLAAKESLTTSQPPQLPEKPTKPRTIEKKPQKKPKQPVEKKSTPVAVGAKTGEPVSSSRRKRAAVNPLYHWSSSSEDESQDLIEVKPIRDEMDDDEDRPVQHGWIVGDSPKKLVTMLAQAKGKKTDVDCVKEQGKKRTSAVS